MDEFYLKSLLQKPIVVSFKLSEGVTLQMVLRTIANVVESIVFMKDGHIIPKSIRFWVSPMEQIQFYVVIPDPADRERGYNDAPADGEIRLIIIALEEVRRNVLECECVCYMDFAEGMFRDLYEAIERRHGSPPTANSYLPSFPVKPLESQTSAVASTVEQETAVWDWAAIEPRLKPGTRKNKRTFIRLWGQGEPAEEIAKQTGWKVDTVWKRSVDYRKELGPEIVPHRRAPD